MFKRAFAALVAIAAATVATTRVIADPLQPLPNPNASANTTLPPLDAGAGLSPERVRQALVSVEVAGRGATGVGIVLDGDGRMITSLTAVGPGDLADVRYADGHVVHARAAHKDTVLDLALLVPLSGRYTTGLLASDLDPTTTTLRSVSLPAGRPVIGPTRLKGRVDAHAKDGTPLTGAMELDTHAATGAPVLDPDGKVLGVIAHACHAADGASCVDVAVVVPILSARIFLSHTPSNAVPPSPWLGINGAPDVVGGIHGVRVQAVAPHSPAERSGMRPQTDMIVVADAQPIDTPERLADIVSKHAVGDTLKLSVFASGRYREVDVTLQAPP